MPSLLAVGDVLIDRDQPAEMFRHVRHVLRQADVVFANSEQMYANDGVPSPVHATASDPRVVEAMLDSNIEVISLANNHTLDWGEPGLLETIGRLRAAGLFPVGAGRDIIEARVPVVLERAGVTFGFLAYGCIGPDGYEADVSKAGHAPMRAWTIYDKVDYQPATPPRIVSLPNREDLRAMTSDVRQLRERCDVLAVSFHWGVHFQERVIPDYCYDVGRAAIDAGADVVLGGHPHILKGAEMYRGKPIFYSLGNFGIELNLERICAEGGGSSRARIQDALDKLQSLYGFVPVYPNYPHPRESLATLIVKLSVESRRVVQASYIPCFVNSNAEPEIVTRGDERGQEVFEYMTSISASENLSVCYEWNEDGSEVVVTP